MERLTEKIGNTNCVKGCGSNCKYGFQHCSKEDWENCQTIDDIIDKLAEYEDLEDKLNGITVKQVVDGFIKTVENQTCEGYEYGRILTNEEADKWNEYKQLEEQGLLLRLPCKVGDTVWRIIISDNYIMPCNVEEFVYSNSLYIAVREELFNTRRGLNINEIGKTVFLTRAEAEQKLKEMESD